MLLALMIFGRMVSVGVTVCLVWGAMWACKRWLYVYVSLAVGSLAGLYFLQQIVRGVIYRLGPRDQAVPAPEAVPDEMLEDFGAALKIAEPVNLYLVTPVGLAAIVWLVWRFWTGQGAELQDAET